MICIFAKCILFNNTIYNDINKSGSVSLENYNSRGEKIKIYFNKSPRRVITFWQNSVETLLALGLENKIIASVGVPSITCIKPKYREAYKNIPIKQMQLLDTEHILMLNPDFIIGWDSTFRKKYLQSTDFWNNRQIHTYIIPSTRHVSTRKSIEDEYNYILDMGNLFKCEKKAKNIVDNMKQEINSIQNKTASRKKIRTIIFEKQKNKLYVYGKNTLAGNILQCVNGKLIDEKNIINYEQLIQNNPEVIFLVVSENNYINAPYIVQEFYNNPALESIDAIKNHRIYSIPLYMIYSSGVRTYDGIKKMASGLYPDLYNGVPVN